MKVADPDYLGCLFTFCGDDPSAGLEATTFRCELKRSYGEHAITAKSNTHTSCELDHDQTHAALYE